MVPKQKQYKFYSLSFTKRAAQTIITIDKNRLVNINYRIMNLHCCLFSKPTSTFTTATKLIIKYYLDEIMTNNNHRYNSNIIYYV